MFDEKTTALFQSLGGHLVMVLATCADTRVTARSMSILVKDQSFYFQTDRTFLKYRQISGNNRVALCANQVQVEGICRELGHPMAEENSWFAKRFQAAFPRSYERYTPMAQETLFVVEPRLVRTWIYEDGEPFRETYDFTAGYYAKEKYEYSV